MSHQFRFFAPREYSDVVGGCTGETACEPLGCGYAACWGRRFRLPTNLFETPFRTRSWTTGEAVENLLNADTDRLFEQIEKQAPVMNRAVGKAEDAFGVEQVEEAALGVFAPDRQSPIEQLG